ncbi:hypothetical protein E1301_Tti013487 [Triplophysa tibetana]|uniref:Uncharacterized protein n=1 Tax=Triplophysa tibetana TaxID=1572043 RepID=A0A5A9NR41_9TELE|nr:hypothetical protein E1301_Tti013487 [Triplophysa tibetana]
MFLILQTEHLPHKADIPSQSQHMVCRGPDGAPEYERVVELARYLVELREKPGLSDREATVIIQLWDRLPDSDKQGFPIHPGTRTRCVLGQGSGPSQWPTMSRTAQAAIRRLMGNCPTLKGNCPTLKGKTRIQLFEVNQRTPSVWYNDYRKKIETDVLSLSLPLPQMSMGSHTSLQVARQKPSGTIGVETAIRPYHLF